MCPNCQTRTTNGKPLCPACEREYLTTIRRIRPTLQNLRQLAERQVRIGDTQKGGGNAFAPSPINWTAQDCYDDIIDWMRNTIAGIDIKWALTPSRQWRRLWAKLLSERNTLLQQPTTADGMHDLTRLMQKADRLLTPADQTIIIGTCPTCDECAQTTHDATHWTCPNCQTTWQTSDIRKQAITRLHQLEYTGTPTMCSKYLATTFGIHINPATIRSWLRRGTLTQTTPTGKNTYRFNLGELAEKA